LAYRGSFKDYLREGDWTFWRPDGIKRMAGVFLNDQRHGLFSMYGLGGELISKANWSRGRLHGEQERFFKSGKCKSILTWVAGQQTGPASIYRELPDTDAEREPGSPVPMRRSLQEEGAYANGRKTGVWVEYHANGKVRATGPCTADERNGLWRFYTQDGSDEARGDYKDDEQSGQWEGYYPTGGKKFDGGFVAGVAQGAWTRWWPSGQKKAQGSILDGKWHGKWLAWDKDGRPDAELSGTYTRGTKDL